MGSSDKFSLKWNDFKENVTSAFKSFRIDQEFANVTLACENNQQMEAHKVILSASSPLFRTLLTQNKHPHPLIYIRGIKAGILTSILDFIYNGEVSIYQEDLNDFLAVAEEMEIKGLTGTAQEKQDMEKKLNPEVSSEAAKPFQPMQTQAQGRKRNKLKKIPVLSETAIKDEDVTLEDSTDYIMNEPEIFATNNEDVNLEERTDYIMEVPDMFQAQYNDSLINGEYDELNQKIKSMMTKTEGMWSCHICQFTKKDKQVLQRHIEWRHIEGMYHPCNVCEKYFSSRHALQLHFSKNHKAAVSNIY